MKQIIIKELIEKVTNGAGYLLALDYIKNFDLTNVKISEIEETSKTWTLTIKKGHNFKHITSSNFGR